MNGSIVSSGPKHRLVSAMAAFALSLLAGGPARADVNIAQTPLFVQPPVSPALLLAVDDSGSMDSEILLRANDGAAWWHTDDRSFFGRNQSDAFEPGVINFNIAGSQGSRWKKYVYLFPNGTGLTNGRRAYSDSTHDHFAVPPIGPFAYVRSPAYNFSYFDPAITYDPWLDLGGYTFTDSDPTAAPTDPTRGSEVLDLTTERERSGTNEVFRFFDGMVIPAGTRYRDWSSGTWVTALSDVAITGFDGGSGGRGVGISYFPATFYLPLGVSLPPDFGYDPARMEGGASVDMDGQAPDGSPMIRYEIRPGNFVTPEAYDRAIQNFANWFTYYRKRHIAARGAIGEAFAPLQGFRVGSYRINTTPDVLMRDLSVNSERDDFFADIYRNFIGSGGTPNRRAVNHMYDQFRRNDSGAPIVESCQMNFGVLFTDGYASDSVSVGNVDSVMGSPFADSVSNTMADIAARMYLTNLRPDLTAGEVPVPSGCNSMSPDPALDCNTNLHANLFAVTLGAPGTIFKIDADATNDPYTYPPTWPTTFPARNPVHVDDLWHATLNSRGELLDVEVPALLGERFGEVLASIGARIEASATSAATSSAVLQTDTLLYTAGFRSTDWSGQLEARSVNADGSLGIQAWDAEERLAARSPLGRKIFTRHTDGTGVTFEYASLSPAQQSALDHAPDGTNDGLGPERINWLRGDEGGPLGFRDRSSTGTARLLGDIVNSNPQFEAGVLYVGANDGMLHAFDAATGEELFAYVPGALLDTEPGEDFAPLSRLPDPNYSHRYFVDGTVSVVDMRFMGVDKTVLVGSLGAGGRAVYALDVSSPGAFDATDVLWEFTHPELGYNVGQPAIVRISDGRMAAVFGNGYNGDSDRAMLFVVDLNTGTLIETIDTGAGSSGNPNGLAAPVVTDWPVSNLRANRVYAGDLHGNMWRFNIGGPTATWNNAANKTAVFSAVGPGGVPQPITARPIIALNPANNDEVVVAFGTGSYFRTNDQDMPGAPVQSLYGIVDTVSGIPSVTRAGLLEQEITSQSLETFGTESVVVRVVSDNVFDATLHQGWYLDLDFEDGERVVNEATFPSGPLQRRVRFSTLVPDFDPCGTGRRGFIMDLDILAGGRTQYTVFDLNRDNAYDDLDTLGGAVISGLDWGQGERALVLTPEDTSGEPPEFIYTGEGAFVKGLGEAGLGGRQSWQQLR
jgi:type IV pilus assembly protein PilY1